jgi:hypothetical protein
MRLAQQQQANTIMMIPANMPVAGITPVRLSNLQNTKKEPSGLSVNETDTNSS